MTAKSIGITVLSLFSAHRNGTTRQDDEAALREKLRAVNRECEDSRAALNAVVKEAQEEAELMLSAVCQAQHATEREFERLKRNEGAH